MICSSVERCVICVFCMQISHYAFFFFFFNNFRSLLSSGLKRVDSASRLRCVQRFRGAFAQRNADKLTEICTKRSDSVSYDATAVISTLR